MLTQMGVEEAPLAITPSVSRAVAPNAESKPGRPSPMNSIDTTVDLPFSHPEDNRCVASGVAPCPDPNLCNMRGCLRLDAHLLGGANQ